MPTKIEKDSISGRDTTGHEWDGVKELNTPLPTWWVYTFYATIVFAGNPPARRIAESISARRISEVKVRPAH